MENYVPILYGSQTGNGESIAELIADAAEDHGIECSTHPMDDFDISPEDKCIIFICSSTGDGELPENARKFVKNLRRKSLPSEHLSHVNFAMLALGDSNYPTFGGGPNTLERILKQKGAKSFYETKLADDATSLEIVVEPWIEGLWKALKLHLQSQPDNTGSTQINDINGHLETNTEVLHTNTNNPLKEVLTMLSPGEVKLPAAMATYLQLQTLPDTFQPQYEHVAHPLQDGDLISSTIEDIKQLTADGAHKQCLEVTLHVPDSCSYQPGDSFGVMIPNNSSEVEWLLQRLNLVDKADMMMKISVKSATTKRNPKVPQWIPEQCTARHLLTNCLEIRSVPKRTFLRLLLDCTSGNEDRDCLKFLSCKEGMEQYLKLVAEPHLNIIDILSFLPSCNPPLELLLEHLPRLQARQYSAASALEKTKNCLKFAFNVVKFPECESRAFSRSGLCTGYFSDVFTNTLTNKNNSLTIFKSKNTSFRLPEDAKTPVIFVGPGTGITPFIGFLELRTFLKESVELGPAWLFYGCRNKTKDFLYEKKIDEFLKYAALQEFKVCFSRDTETKKYVQDNLVEHENDVLKLILDDGGVFYVCGDARNMCKDVRKTMVSMVAKYKGISEADANNVVKELIKEKRYKEDVWT